MTTKHRPHSVSRSEFGRRAKRSASSITEACTGPLRAACLPGGRIDAAHPAAVAWASKRGIDPVSLIDPLPVATAPPSAAEPSRRRGRPTAAAKVAAAESEAAAPDHRTPANINDLLDLPLREIIVRHESLQNFGDWLGRRKTIANIAKTEFATARSRDLYVPRVYVEQFVLGLIEAMNLRLLRDVKVTATSSLFTLARSGASLEAGQKELYSIMSQNMKYAMDKAVQLSRTIGGSGAKSKRKTLR